MAQTHIRYTVGSMHDWHTIKLMPSIDDYQHYFDAYWKQFEKDHQVRVLVVQKGAFAQVERMNDPMRPATIPRGEFVSRAMIVWAKPKVDTAEVPL